MFTFIIITIQVVMNKCAQKNFKFEYAVDTMPNRRSSGVERSNGVFSRVGFESGSARVLPGKTSVRVCVVKS